jgi:hypothetical protein
VLQVFVEAPRNVMTEIFDFHDRRLLRGRL